jgi:hypothetical protein
MSLIINGRSVQPDFAEKNARIGYDGGLITTTSGLGLPVQHFLTLTGSGLPAERNLNGDYSAADTDAYWEVPAGVTYDAYSVMIVITDNASFNQTDFGAITAGTVVNGIRQYIRMDGGVYTPLLSGYAISANYHWFSMAHDIVLTTFAGSGQTLSINVDLVKSFGGPLHLQTGWRYVYRMHDNFTGLISQTVTLRGKQY